MPALQACVLHTPTTLCVAREVVDNVDSQHLGMGVLLTEVGRNICRGTLHVSKILYEIKQE